MQTLAPFKRGDSFFLTATYKVDGVPQSILGFDIESQVRNSYGMNLVDDFSISILESGENNIGQFVISELDTSAWPIGSMLCDIKLSAAGVSKHSDSFLIPVIERITL